MQLKYLSCIFLLLVFIAGCAKEQVYRGMYDGMQKREQIVAPSNEPIPQEQPSYDKYTREREEILEKDSK